MNSMAILKVILVDNSSQRLTFQTGLPRSVNELVIEVQRQCEVNSNFRQFMDALFDNDFMNLTSMDEVKDRGTIKVIPMVDGSTPHCSNSLSTSAPAHVLEDSSSLSSGCVDTDILSSTSSGSSGSRSVWPSIFCVPQFLHDAELKLEQGHAMYREKGDLLIPDPKLRSNILEGLVQEIVQYKVYVTDKQFDMVGEALVKKHPCLTERGSLTDMLGGKLA